MSWFLVVAPLNQTLVIDDDYQKIFSSYVWLLKVWFDSGDDWFFTKLTIYLAYLILIENYHVQSSLPQWQLN